MTDKNVTVTLDLKDSEAWCLALFLKRVGLSEFRANAQDDDEAYAMQRAAERVQAALAEAGYAPR